MCSAARNVMFASQMMRTSCVMCAFGTCAEHITSLCGEDAIHHCGVSRNITCAIRRKHHFTYHNFRLITSVFYFLFLGSDSDSTANRIKQNSAPKDAVKQCRKKLYYISRLFGSSRKSNRSITKMPFSLYSDAGTSFVIMIFLNPSPVKSSGRCSRFLFVSSGRANADWI